MTYTIEFDKEQNTLYQTENKEFNKAIENIKDFINKNIPKDKEYIMLLYPMFHRIQKFEDIYDINNLYVFIAYKSDEHPGQYQFCKLTNNKKKIKASKINNYKTDAYARIYDKIRFHQLIALNYCDKEQCKNYIESILNKTGKITKIDIDHIDSNKNNNNPSNLIIISHIDNLKKRHPYREQVHNVINDMDFDEAKKITIIDNIPLKYNYYLYNNTVFREYTGKTKIGVYKEIKKYPGNDGKDYYKIQKKPINSYFIKTAEELQKIINKQNETEQNEQK